MDRQFTNLVEMQEYSCEKFSKSNIFGTKVNGKYEWITYADFKHLVDQARGGLKKLGVSKGDKVAIISNNSKEWAIAAYATYSLGAIFVPLYEMQLETEWEYILKDCDAKIVITANTKIFNIVMKMKPNLKNVQDVFNVELKNSKDSNSFNFLLELGKNNLTKSFIPDSSDLMSYIYTSGTTGKPKGVELTHGNIMSNINCAPLLIDVREGDVTLSFLPWGHIFGQMAELHLLIYAGFCTGFAENANTIIDNLAEIKPHILFAVPRLFNRIYDGVNAKMKDEGGLAKFLFDQGMKLANKKKEKKSLSLPEEMLLKLVDKIVFTKIRARFGGRMRFAVSGSAALSVDVAKFIDNLNIQVYEGYGLSETSPLISVNTPKDRKLGSVGKVIPNVRVTIDKTVVNGHSQEGEGEIICYGPNVMKGYHNLPDETKNVIMPDGGFRTGDLGKIDKEGFLHITGRIKEQYKLENGKYVVPSPLEEQIKLSPFINQVFIFGDNKPHNIALIGIDKAQLKKYLKREKNIDEISDDELYKSDMVNQIIKTEIDTYQTEFKNFEKIKRFALVKEEWGQENGYLTPSMKLKRSFVINNYKDKLDNLYN